LCVEDLLARQNPTIYAITVSDCFFVENTRLERGGSHKIETLIGELGEKES
jgi:hypothetical protein